MRRTTIAVAFLVWAIVPSEAGLQADCENGKNPSAAITACSQLLKSESFSKSRRSQILINRGLAYFDTGNYHSALKDSNAAIELIPDRFVGYALRAHVLASLGKKSEALRDINDARVRAARELQGLKRTRIWAGSNMALSREVRDQIKNYESAIAGLETLESALQNENTKAPDSEVADQIIQPSPTLPSATTSAGIFERVVGGVVLVTANDGIGTGIVVSASGDILTSMHVIGSRTEAAVAFYKDREVVQSDFMVARVTKTDPTKDMALLRLDTPPKKLTVFQLGTLDSVSIGQEVNAIGHPDGALWTFTRGYISQIRPNFSWSTNGIDHRGDVIQTQTPINPGNSGGPLFDNDGKLIGINTFMSTGVQGIYWAVAVSEIQKFLGALPMAEKPPATLEKIAADLVENYFRTISISDDEALKFLQASYAASVMYFGKPTYKDDVISDKRDFFLRWPHRTYRLRSNGLSIRCARSLCSVLGVVDWWVGNRVRQSSRRGTANYEFEVALIDSGPFIRLETSNVTHRVWGNWTETFGLDAENGENGKSIEDRIAPEP